MSSQSSGADLHRDAHEDDDWEFPTIYHERAFAVHAVSEAIVAIDMEEHAGDVSSWLEMVEQKILHSACAKRLDLKALFDTLMSTLKFYHTNGGSSRWSPRVWDLLKNVHSVHVQRLDSSACKEEVRCNSRYHCHLCGTHEKNCTHVVHLATGKTAHGDPAYHSDNFLTTDMDKLLDSWQDFIKFYTDLIASKDTPRDDRCFAPAYAGIVVPGQTCLRHLLLSIKSQNLVMETIYQIHTDLTNGMYDINILPASRFGPGDVAQTAELLEMLHSAQAKGPVPSLPEDLGFWETVLARFARTSGGVLDGIGKEDPRFLRVAYERMTQQCTSPVRPRPPPPPPHHIDAADDTSDPESSDPESDDVEDDEEVEVDEVDEVDKVDEEEDAVVSPRGTKRTFVVLTDEEDAAPATAPVRRPFTRASTKLPAPAPAPAASTRTPAPAPAPAPARTPPPRTGDTARHQTRLIDAAASETVSSSMARGLRVHPDNPLHSRRETLSDLIRISNDIEDMNQKGWCLHTAYVIAKGIALREAGTAPDPTGDFSKEMRRAMRCATALAAQLAKSSAPLQHTAIVSAAVITLAELGGAA